jgi:cytolysin (calcineurin-like family phosphatase)
MPHIVEVLAWLSAAIIAVGVIWSKGIVPVAKWIRSAATQVRRALGIIDTLADIADEFKPNGGHSLHDKIARIEADVLEVKRDTEALKHSVKQVQEEEMVALNLMLAQVLADTGELRALD